MNRRRSLLAFAVALACASASAAGFEDALSASVPSLEAQGDDIPSRGGVSRAIVQQRPVCLDQGLRALADIHSELSVRQRAARDQAFPKAERYMRNAAAAGGIIGHREEKFENVPADPPNARVDVTVFVGKAFVDCSAAISAP